MKKKFLLASFGVLAFASLAACVSEMKPTATPAAISPGEVALTMVSQRVNAEATQMAVNVQFTATAQIVGATATAQAYIYAQATAEQARRDAMATEQQRRQDAAATEQRRRDDIAATQAVQNAIATAEQQQREVQWTATAQQSAVWNAMTQTAIPIHSAWTQQAVVMQQAKERNDLELSTLEVERQRKSNLLQAYTPYVIAFLAMIIGALIADRWSRTREIKDEDGNLEGVIVDGEFIRPSLLPGAMLDLANKSVPQLTDPENEKEIKRREQAIQMMRSIPTQPPMKAATSLYNNIFASENAQPFRILRGGEMPPSELISGDTVQALDEDWKAKANDGHPTA